RPRPRCRTRPVGQRALPPRPFRRGRRARVGRRPAGRHQGCLRPPTRKTTLMPRPGFVLEVDRSTPPTLFWHGENFRLARLPAGSRIIYPPEALDPLPDPDEEIRRALLEPLGSDPLPALLTPGMKLTIAFDDVSL